MNKNRFKNRIPGVRLGEALEELVTQWKLILIFMVVMAFFTAGIRYRSALNAYNAQIESVRANQTAEAELQESEKEDSISSILESLSDQDRTEVKKVLSLETFIYSQQEYLEKSYLLNSEAGNQHGIYFTLKVDADNPEEQQELSQGYTQFLKSNRFLQTVKNAINPNAEDRYIRELIQVNWSPVSREKDSIYDPDIGYYITVFVVVPEGTASGDIISSVESVTAEFRREETDIIAHKISIESEEQYYNDYNTEELKLKTARNIIDNEAILATQVRGLSDVQRNAYTTIWSLKFPRRGEVILSEDKIPKPGISKKNILIGAFLGFAIYCFLFIILYIFNGTIKCAEDAEFCSDTRVIGNIYYPDKKNKLLHSRFINKIRYKGQLSVDNQLKKTIRNILALCRYYGTTVISMPIFGKNINADIISDISKAVSEEGIEIVPFELIGKIKEFDEQDVSKYKYSIPIILGGETYTETFNGWMNICDSYDNKALGVVYYKNI